MRIGACVTVGRSSIRLSHRLTAAMTATVFTAEHWAGDIDQYMRVPALSSKCG